MIGIDVCRRFYRRKSNRRHSNDQMKMPRHAVTQSLPFLLDIDLIRYFVNK